MSPRGPLEHLCSCEQRHCLVVSSRCCWQSLLGLGPPRPAQHPIFLAIDRVQTVHADLLVGIARPTGRLGGFPTGRPWGFASHSIPAVLPDPFLESQASVLRYRRIPKTAGSDWPHLREAF